MSRSTSKTLEDEEESLSGIEILPEELLITIFKFLTLDAILECENVCRHWRKLARDAALWRRILLVYSGKPGQSEISEKSLNIITTHSECVHCVKLQYVYSYPVIKSVIENCHNLISIELVMCRIGKEFETDVSQWPNLRKLNLKNSLLLLSNEDLVIQFDQFKNLNYLALSDFGLTSANWNTLLKCNYLCHIYIEKIRGLSLEYIRDLILSKQKILVTFHIYGDDSVNDKCLSLLSKCPLLKDLAIIRCANLTDQGLVSLADLNKIEHLQLWNNLVFSEMSLQKTLESPSFKKLKSLSLSRIGNISPVIVDVISEYYKNLKFLALYQCPKIINTDYEKQLKSKFRNIDVVLY